MVNNVQPTYVGVLPVAYAGMIANMEKHNKVSKIAEGTIGFGKVVLQGVGDNGVVAPSAGAVFDAATSNKAGNTGNGVLTLATPKTGTGAQVGRYVITIIEPAANGGIFEVQDPGGINLPSGAIGVAYANQVNFTLADGATDFVSGDQVYVDVTATGVPTFVGISVKDPTVNPANSDQFVATEQVPVLNYGVVWVLNGSGGIVKPRQPAYFVPTTGVITNSAAAPNLPIPNTTFDSTAANGALVKLRVGTY